MATLGVDWVHSESVTLLGSYYCEFAEWPLSDYARSKPGAFPSVFLRLLQIFSPERSDRQAAEVRLQFFTVVVAAVVTMLAFHGVGCVHLSSLAVTVLMTSWSSFCLFQRLLHYSFLTLAALRTEVMLEFFAKVDDNPNWFPGKHAGTKRGVERVGGMLCWKRTRNGHWLQILRGNPYLSDSDR